MIFLMKLSINFRYFAPYAVRWKKRQYGNGMLRLLGLWDEFLKVCEYFKKINLIKYILIISL